jgi:hypothetical protein
VTTKLEVKETLILLFICIYRDCVCGNSICLSLSPCLLRSFPAPFFLCQFCFLMLFTLLSKRRAWVRITALRIDGQWDATDWFSSFYVTVILIYLSRTPFSFASPPSTSAPAHSFCRKLSYIVDAKLVSLHTIVVNTMTYL